MIRAGWGFNGQSLIFQDNNYIGIVSDTDLLQLTDGVLVVNGFARAGSSVYRRYYHMPLTSFDPGASGATWIPGSANSCSGWKLDDAGELLYAHVDVHPDWDGATDLVLEVKFQINAASAENDTVDLKAVFHYMDAGDSVTKTQTVEVSTNVGDGGIKAQYTKFGANFIIDHDLVDNLIVAGDDIGVTFNLETDTSDVDDITINKMSFYYQTTHIGIESGDA